MARTMLITEEELNQARKLRDEATSATDFRKAMTAILIAELGLTPYRTAELLGTSRCTTFRDHLDVRNQDDSKKKSWGGHRRFIMTFEGEAEFLTAWECEARAGGVLSVPPIHAALAKLLGRDIPPSSTYLMLARHGWRKVQADTKHPKSDPAVKEEFKKTPRAFGCRPFEKHDNLPVSGRGSFCTDEWPSFLLVSCAFQSSGQLGAYSGVSV